MKLQNKQLYEYLRKKLEFQNELKTSGISIKFLVDANHKVLDFSII